MAGGGSRHVDAWRSLSEYGHHACLWQGSIKAEPAFRPDFRWNWKGNVKMRGQSSVTTTTVDHFATIAPRYNNLRTTDAEVVDLVTDVLPAEQELRVADVGCGSGRYDIALLNRIGKRIHLTCLDLTSEMLKTLDQDLREQALARCCTIRAAANGLPFRDQHLDAVLTFNAIHHFDMPCFLRECARILVPHGLLIIYTRTRSQNARNVWGRYFPRFAEKENRLYELRELQKLLDTVPSLELETIRELQFKRTASLHWLERQARNHHYSTFALYEVAEFEWAMKQFQRNLRSCFSDIDHITWCDENTALVARKSAAPSGWTRAR